MPVLATTRWLFSTNAKDIGTLYLMFGVFTGLLGTAFSILVRLELSAPGSQFLAGGHQLYNVIATTHGIMMIYFMVVYTLYFVLHATDSPAPGYAPSYVNGLVAFALAYAVCPTLSALVNSLLALGLMVPLYLLSALAVCWCLSTLACWLTTGLNLSEPTVKYGLLTVYTCLLLAAYLYLCPTTLHCDESMVIDFLLNGAAGPKLDGQLGSYLLCII
jgi:hypothetical protein